MSDKGIGYRAARAGAAALHDPLAGELHALVAQLRQANEAAAKATVRLRRSEARLAFLLELNARLRPLTDPEEIQFEAARALGDSLGASRVGYAEDQGDGEHILVARHYTCGVPSIEGRYRYEHYGAALLGEFRAGRVVVRGNVAADPTLTDAEKAVHAEMQIGSTVNVPLLKGGRLVAVLFMHHVQPRTWSDDELALLEAMGARIWDAVQRARAEGALRASEAKYRSLFDSIDEGFVIAEMIYDGDKPVDYLIVESNPAQQKMTGLADVVGKRIRELIPDFENDWLERFGRVARTGEPLRIESRIAGIGRWFDVHAFRVDGAGSGRVAIIFSDITSRKRDEASLRESAERQAFLVRLGDALRPIKEPQAVTQAAARILAEHFGVAAAGYIEVESDENTIFSDGGYNDGRVPSHRGWYRLSDYGEAFADVLRSGRELCVEDFHTDPRGPAGGTPATNAVRMRSTASFPLLKGGRLVGFFYAMHHEPRTWLREERAILREVAERTWDAIERARAEAALRASETRYRTLVENLRDYAIFMTDAAGHVNEWTLGAQRVEGYTPEEIVGRPVSVFYTPEDIAAGEPERELAEAAREGRAEREGWRLRKDGGRIWVNEITTSVHGPDGVLAGFAKIGRDLSARRRAEEALQVADRRKDEFLATLAHELRNPLAPLRNGLNIARLTSRSDPTLGRTIDMMDRQLSHLVRLVDDLLDVGRISSGKLELRRRPIGLGEVLASSVEAARASVEAQQHELVVETDAAPRTVLGDFDRLAQVFTNLLTNAAKYTEPGGRIRLSLSHEGDDEVVRVEDNGIGIPPDELNRVFDLFSQVRSHQGRTTGGLGIGLSIVRKLVELHGGTVDASSAGIGSGSAFSVRLPALAPQEQAPEPDGAERVPADTVTSRRVLIVDDNVDAATSLSGLLELLGHQAWLAHDGFDAVEMAARLQPDLVLLDLGMPRMDGFEAARRLRALPGGERLWLAALTGWGQASDRECTRAAGIDWHLVKPVDVAVLGEILDGLMPRSSVPAAAAPESIPSVAARHRPT